MRPRFNRTRLYAKTITHKFQYLDEITVDKLNFRPMVDETSTVTYGTVKVINECIKLLHKVFLQMHNTILQTVK